MSTTINLKAQARTYEQQEQWSSALDAYEKLVAEPPEGEELDLGLWNRIGDLHMRLGQASRAVNAYQQAVSAYEEAGLHNNALALCRKILRISPDHSEAYLTLGLISAMKGFATDARSHLQQFLGLASRGDRLEGALSSLLQSARQHAGDADVLQLLVEKLRENGWGDRLEDELTPESERLRSEGLLEEADRVHRILQGESIPASTDRHSQRSARPLDADLIASDPAATQQTSEAPPAAEGGSGRDSVASGEAAPADLDLQEISPLSGLQSDHSPGAAGGGRNGDSAGDLDVAMLADLEGGPTDELDDEDSDAEPIPLISFEPELDVSSLGPIDVELASEEGGAGAVTSPRGLDRRSDRAPEADEDSDEVEELPLLGFESGASERVGADVDLHIESGPNGWEDEEEEADEVGAGGLPLIDLAADERSLESPESGGVQTTGSAGREARPEPSTESDAAAPAEEYIDLSSLIFEDDEPATTRFVVDAEEPSGNEDQDFAEMLAAFREQVARNIDVDDNSSHYDLGVAFREMGLYDEAISEFQTALRAGANPVATMEMLGECFIEKGQHAVAWRVLDQAVRLSGASDSELVGVLYLMGRCEESLGRGDAALECYERVLTVDIRFRDTGSRLQALRG